jgi:hypothetical protein
MRVTQIMPTVKNIEGQLACEVRFDGAVVPAIVAFSSGGLGAHVVSFDEHTSPLPPEIIVEIKQRLKSMASAGQLYYENNSQAAWQAFLADVEKWQY